MTLLDITDLEITYRTEEADVHAVNGVSFSVDEGTNYGLAGESGSGKSTVAQAILGLLPDNGTVTGGEITFNGHDLLALPPDELREILWEEIAFIPQSAMDSLDPVMTTGAQIRQAMQKHRDVSDAAARDRVRELYEMVGLDPARIDDYPHQFSGGMRQRVTIAMALALEPSLIIADEPTTGLDVIVQDKIIDQIRDLQDEIDSSLLIITHDIGVIAETCEELSILYGGKVMEKGHTEDVLARPTNPYTMGLKNSFPEVRETDREAVSIPGSPPNLTEPESGCAFRDRCPFAGPECETNHPDLQEMGDGTQHSACHYVDRATEMRRSATNPETWGITAGGTNDGKRDGDEVLVANDLQKWFAQNQSFVERLRGTEPEYVKAVDGVSFTVRKSEILGIAGESGCGKSTLGETVALLQEPTGGDIEFNGSDIAEFRDGNMKSFRRQAQVIFQDPFDSLNPRLTVRQLVGEPLTVHGYDVSDRDQRIAEILERVGLDPASEYLTNYPHQLSGGERQRVAIARALVLNPDFLVCDEPASMLDVSLKVNLLNLLRELADEEDIGIIYISHDLASLAQVTDRLAVMYLGRIVELGDTERVVSEPKHPYSDSLLRATPEKDPRVDRERVLLSGDPPDPIDLPTGCNFADRCPNAREKCRQQDPNLEETTFSGQSTACFFPVENEGETVVEAEDAAD